MVAVAKETRCATYRNGQTANYTDGSCKLPDGSSTTRQGLLDVCAWARKACRKNLTTYKARKGTSQDAWLFSAVYAAWLQQRAAE